MNDGNAFIADYYRTQEDINDERSRVMPDPAHVYYTIKETVEVTGIVVTVEADNDPDLSWLDQTDEQMGEGFEVYAKSQKAAYNRGDWHMVGICADLVVNGRKASPARYPSASLWGIESDSDREYVETVVTDLVDELRKDLKDLCDTANAHTVDYLPVDDEDVYRVFR